MLEEFNPELTNPLADMTLAGAGNRLVAAIIDGLIVGFCISLLYIPMTMFVGMEAIQNDGESISPFILMPGMMLIGLASVCISWGYYVYFESSEKQATFGKQAMKIKVVSDSGQRITFLNGLGRVVAKVLSGAICYIGYLMILFRKDEKGLHDLIASTYVVKA